MDIKEAHKFCTQHKESLLKSERCACFYCLKTFNPSEIKDWVDDNSDTALCAHCGIDSVLAEIDVPEALDENFLQEMHNHWF